MRLICRASSEPGRGSRGHPFEFNRAGQKDAIPVAGRPPGWAAQCMWTEAAAGQAGYGAPGGCGAAGLRFTDAAGIRGSYQLSQALLQVTSHAVQGFWIAAARSTARLTALVRMLSLMRTR